MKVNREAEWIKILELAKTNPNIAYWLKEREERHRLGQPTDAHTSGAREQYRLFMQGKIDADGRPTK